MHYNTINDTWQERGVSTFDTFEQAAHFRLDHHLHRKTQVLSCELAKCCAFFDLSVGPAMFFSRRWMLCAGNEQPV
jgi:hypothetical protein